MTSSPHEPGPAPHPTGDLADDDVFRELEQLHEKRLDTLRHGSDSALENSTRRITELEDEYRHRYPQREVEGRRVRPDDSPGS